MSSNTPTDPLDVFSKALLGRVGADAEAWVSDLSSLIATVTADWDLIVTGAAIDISAFGMTIPAVLGEQRVSLRIGYPDGWFHDERIALEAWDGTGAIRLLRYDPRGAQLREAPDPGTPLSAERNAMRALRLAADALRSLWIPAPDGLQTLSIEARTWLDEMPDRFEATHQPFDRTLLRDAEQLFRSFIPTQADRVLLHGDARIGAFVREGDQAVASDPKPLVGEPAFDVASLLRDRPEEILADAAGAKHLLQARLDQLTDLLEVSASRVKGWAFAVAVDLGLLAYEGGDPPRGDVMIEIARLCQSLSA